METVSDFIFWGSKITVDGDCSHEIKRRLLFGRKVMTNLLLLLLSHFSRVRLFAVILGPLKIKSVIVCIVSPPICHEVMGLDAMILVF